LQRELVRGQIGRMVNDVIIETRRRVQDSGVATLEDVHAAPHMLACFSADMAREERTLKQFMYDQLYYHPDQVATATSAHRVITLLFEAYRADPAGLPESWRAALPESEPGRSRCIADYVAGMTDRYAMNCYTRLFGSAPAGLQNV
jgi:dGTPase